MRKFSSISLWIIVCIHLTAASLWAQKDTIQTAEAIGTITKMYSGLSGGSSRSYNHNYSPEYMQINYAINGTEYSGKVYDIYPYDEFREGQKLMVRYDLATPNNFTILLYKPYFFPSELPDTTEGMIATLNDTTSCQIYYKTYDPNDSFDVTIQIRNRYLSNGMFDTLLIKENFVYKVVYNKNNLSVYNSEILFKDLITNSGTALNNQTYMALYHMTTKSPLEAIVNLNNCMRLDPANPFYIFQRAKCYADMFENEKALADYNTYIQMSPKETRGYIRRAIINIRLKQYDNAINDLNNVLTHNQNHDEANYLMGVILYDKGEYSKAIEYYNKAIAHSNRNDKSYYYYDLALAEQKVSGQETKSIADFSEAEQESIKNNYKRIYGDQPHPDKLHAQTHSLYVTLTLDNSLVPYTAINGDMKATLSFPYTIQQQSGPVQANTYNHSMNMNHGKNTAGINIGMLGFEVGAYKRIYGRAEAGFIILDGNGRPMSIRTVIGYNVKFSSKDKFIFRPEIGFTYINRQMQFHTINYINGSSTVTIQGQNFTPSTRYTTLNISLRENVFNFSPSIGIWFRPYQSRLVLRANIGYTCTISQQYSVYFQAGNKSYRENPDQTTISFTNTNGQSTNFFKYSGLFAGISVGIRIQ